MRVVVERADASADRGTVYDVAPGGLFRGGVSGSGDEDWVQVSLIRGETYGFTARPLGVGGLADPRITLLDDHGNPRGGTDGGGTGAAPFLAHTATYDGPHFVAVSGSGGAGGGRYEFAYDIMTVETMDAPASGRTPYSLASGQAFSGTAAADDRDWIAVALDGGTTYRFALLGAGGGTEARVRLHAADGTVVARDDTRADEAGGPSFTYTPDRSGAYYVDVSGGGGEGYLLAFGDGRNEADDAPATTDTPYAIRANAVFAGDLDGPDDADWVAVRLSAGTEYRFSLMDDGGPGGLTDGVLTLFDPTGTAVASDDDGGTMTTSYFAYTPSVAGIHYLEATGDGPLAFGAYEMAVTAGNIAATSRSETITGSHRADAIALLAGNDLFEGRGGNDTIDGGTGDDTISGGPGADVIAGGPGVDLLDFSAATGRVFADLGSDQRGQGFLAFFTAGQAEGDVYAGLEAVAGGDFADNLRGDDGDNTLLGGGVSDRLYGRLGDDLLAGGTGADALYGNLGADLMFGGPDAGRSDRFIYFSAAESGVGAADRDVIGDFVPGEDRIEISRLDADETRPRNQAFEFIGARSFGGNAGELRIRAGRDETIVQADTDGDGRADFEIGLDGRLLLTASDFLL